MTRSLSLRSANLLYLLTMLLVVSLGSLVQSLSFGWGLLATEFLLILLPALLFLRFNPSSPGVHLPLRQALRLNPISPGVGLAALMIGAGAMLVDSLISGIMVQITGYSVSLGPAGIPSNALDATLIALSLVIAAPLCEEVLFRGAILGAYRSTFTPKTALLITGLLFAFYHLQLQGAVALLPIAFLLGYVAWRANSLYASMLAHFANNALSAILLLTYALSPEIRLPYPSLPAGGAGLLLIAAGVFWLNRLAPRPVEEPPAPSAPRLSWLARFWPLLAAALVYLAMAVVEVGTFAVPELRSASGIPLTAPPAWDQPLSSAYQIHNKAGDPVGRMTCVRARLGEAIQLDCHSQVRAYQVTVGGGAYMSSGGKADITARWSPTGLRLLSLDGKMSFDNGGWYTWSAAPDGDQLRMQVKQDSGKQDELRMPPDALLNFEWPQRLAAAGFQLAQANRVTLARENTYRPEKQDTGPALENAVLVVRGAEKVGRATAWRVTAGKFTLWYAVDGPHQLLKYDDGIETYTLE